MKKIINIFFLLSVVFASSCIEQEFIYETYDGSVVEFDATVLNAPAPGLNYPILTRIPSYGFQVVSTGPIPQRDPIITRTSGQISFRVNFVSAHRSTDQTINYTVVADATTAVAGVHYGQLSGTLTIPANSSYGDFVVNVLDPGPGTGSVDLVVQLEGNGSDILPNENYKTLGIRISQQ